jgi:chorismate mutase/prephenate dehydratase
MMTPDPAPDPQAKDRARTNAGRVAFQGAEGAYSHIAARRYFSGAAGPVTFAGFPTFARALREAESGDAGFAFLPIENTTAGSINETYDLLRHTALNIVGEEILQVRHCLLGLPEATAGSVKRILSHPQALAQCGGFLQGLPHAEPVAFVDTALAARRVAEERDPTQAAIASEEAGTLHGLVVLARDVADQEENWTRFVIVSSLDVEADPRLPSKTSLVLALPHRPGALAHCLKVLADHGLNLTKLESRPVPRHPWEYLFYLDFEGSVRDESASDAIATLSRECPYLKILGSYPSRTAPRGPADAG